MNCLELLFYGTYTLLNAFTIINKANAITHISAEKWQAIADRPLIFILYFVNVLWLDFQRTSINLRTKLNHDSVYIVFFDLAICSPISEYDCRVHKTFILPIN